LWLNIDVACAWQSRCVTEGIGVAFGNLDEAYLENFTNPTHAKEIANKIKRQQVANE